MNIAPAVLPQREPAAPIRDRLFFDRPAANHPVPPDDLRSWIDHESLADLTRRAVLSINHPSPIPPHNTAPVPPAPLFLLTYCYASGIYSSAAVIESLEVDLTLRLLWSRELPGTAQLRNFRRTFRPQIECCLRTVLDCACQTRWCRLPHRGAAGSGGGFSSCTSTDTEDPFRDLVETEARRRVDWAVQLDSMALDE